MFIVSEAEATAIRTAFEQRGEFSAAVEPRRLFPGVTVIAEAWECALSPPGSRVFAVGDPDDADAAHRVPRRCERRDQPDRGIGIDQQESDNGVLAGPMIDQVTGSLSSFTADGAYDQEGVYAAVADRHSEAAVIVPSRATAVSSGTAVPTQRDRHLLCIAGPHGLAESVSLHQTLQSRGRHRPMEQVIGDGLRSRMDERRATAVEAAVHVLNRMLVLGRPNYVRIV